MRTSRLFQRLLELSPQHGRELLIAFPVVVLFRIGLAVLTFRRLRSLINRVSWLRPNALAASPADAQRIAWAIRTAARFVPGASCLTQALAGKLLLTNAGCEAEIRFGVANDDQGTIEAHAWVESGGRAILGDEDLFRYAVLEDSVSGRSGAVR